MATFSKILTGIFVFSVIVTAGGLYLSSLNEGTGNNYATQDLTALSQINAIQQEQQSVFENFEAAQLSGSPATFILAAQAIGVIIKSLGVFLTLPFTTLVDAMENYLFLPHSLALLLKSYALFFTLLTAAIAALLRWWI